MSEYFIRYPDSEEAKGPYNTEQLQSLSESKKVTADTLYYDDDKEVWLAFSSNADLLEELFPAEKKLTLKKKSDEDLDLLNKPDSEETQKVHIEDILAAAEGNTEDTKSKKSKAKWVHITVGFTSLSLTITFILSAVGLLYLHFGTIQTQNVALIARNPFIIMAVIDLFLSICLALSVTTIYPIVRLRAAIGLAFLALYFYSFGEPVIAALISISMVGTFINTFTTRASVFLFSGPGSVGGMIGFLFLYYLYLNPLQS